MNYRRSVWDVVRALLFCISVFSFLLALFSFILLNEVSFGFCMRFDEE